MVVLSYHATDVQNISSLYDEAFVLVTTPVVVSSCSLSCQHQLMQHLSSLETSPLATVERGDRKATRSLASKVTIPLHFRQSSGPWMWMEMVAFCLAM